MEKIKEFLSIDRDNYSKKTIILLIALAWIFGVLLRMVWVYQYYDQDQYRWNDQLMINTNDGYYWAEGARDLIDNVEVVDERSPIYRALPIITAGIAKLLPFISLETLMLYLPAAFGSLIVVPIILLASSLGYARVGFAGSLIAVIAHSYYNRTMVGYFDDDMLVVVLPLFVLATLILSTVKHSNKYLIAVPLTILISHWYYPGSYSLHLSMSVILLLYTLAFHRNSLFNYKVLAFSLLAVAYISLSIKLFVVVMALAAFLYLKEKADRYTIHFLIGSVLFVLFTGGFTPIFYQLESYVFRTETVALASDLHFYNVVQTVREASSIDFDTFASRISGHTITFIVALVGTVIFMIAHRVLLLALPFVALGFLAHGIPPLVAPAGLRFTIYAVPVLALGFGYLTFFIASKISVNRSISFAIAGAITIAGLVPNILHIYNYRVPTVFNNYEVQALDEFKKMVEPRKDYAISWWDYGYPIRYYSFAKTLADGGQHDGKDNFVPSFALTIQDQEAASKLLRSAVEMNEKLRETNDAAVIVAEIMKEQKFDDPTQFLLSLTDDIYKISEKTREIYLVLPFRMSEIFSTVALFSNIDLKSGRQLTNPFFNSTTPISDTPALTTFANGMQLNKQNGTVIINGRPISIKHLSFVYMDNNDKEHRQVQTINPNGKLSVIYFSHFGMFWIVDDLALNSNFIQLFAFENYNSKYLELVVQNPTMKIYRIKI